MGCLLSCCCKKRASNKGFNVLPLNLNGYFDDTLDVRDDMINRISMITKNRNIIDKEEGRPTIIAHKYCIDGEALHCGGFGCVYGCIDIFNPIEIEIAREISRYIYMLLK